MPVDATRPHGIAALTKPTAARRRELLRRGGLIGVWLGLGIGGSRQAFAAADPLFDARLMSDVLGALDARPVSSTAIDLDLPDLSENGAMVPVTVTSRLPRTSQIALLAESNPYPLVAHFDITPDTEAFIATRVKLAESCSVHALVKADGLWYWTAKDTAVTEGGCGG